MGKDALRYRWFAITGGLFLLVAILWLLSFHASPLDGVVKLAAERVNPGMSQDEAVAVIRQCGTVNLNTYYFQGATHDGRSFTGCIDLYQLPPAAEVAWAELNVSGEDGNELFIDLGPGGVVTGVRLNTPWSLQGWWYALRQRMAH
jgi:hypothetical protein